MGNVDKLERRMYQELIVTQIIKSKRERKNIIVELDAGMGKRIISFLLTRFLYRDERMLIITPSQTSLKDTVSTFKDLGISANDLGYITANTPSRLREKFLSKKRIVIATPISLANILRRKPDLLADFSLIIINEIDKVVRRVAETDEFSHDKEISTAKELTSRKIDRIRRIRLVYPWNELKKYFSSKTCLVGMSGTLRDKHILRLSNGEISFVPELETLINSLFPRDKPLTVLTMDTLIQRTDAGRYIVRNITIVKKIGVIDNKIQALDSILTNEIRNIGRKIMDRYKEMFVEKNIEKLEKGLPLIPDTDFQKRKYLRLALVRRFIFASLPEHYSRFLKKRSIRSLIERSLGISINEAIPEESTKIRKIVEIATSWTLSGRKITVLCSFIRVAEKLYHELKARGIKAYLLTGKTPNKGEILERFKKLSDAAVLIMTPVGERDIDLSQIDLIIVHDVISTVKTMYQRIKRGRRCLVSIIYYRGTQEEKKVHVLLDRMKKLYPWSLKVES